METEHTMAALSEMSAQSTRFPMDVTEQHHRQLVRGVLVELAAVRASGARRTITHSKRTHFLNTTSFHPRYLRRCALRSMR
jgi:hypothetical protein